MPEQILPFINLFERIVEARRRRRRAWELERAHIAAIRAAQLEQERRRELTQDIIPLGIIILVAIIFVIIIKEK